jgi:hypothetical protein
MATRLIRKTWKVEDVLTNATSVKLSDPTATFGVKRNDTDAVVVADDTAMANVSTGVYEYSFEDIVGVSYTAYVEVVYAGATYHFEVDLPARAASGSMGASYNSLVERVGHFLFGIRSGFSSDQTDDIEECIMDGLQDVYAAHPWSFFRPIQDISTTAPYATGTVTIAAGVVTLTGGTFPSWAADGLLKVADGYYSVASRDTATQITLDDTSVTVATASSFELGRPEIPLPAAFDAIANDSDLTYYPDQNELYPSVQARHDQALRTYQQNDPYYDRPVFYSIRTVEFDPSVGSRKVLAFYPTPDAAYVLRVPMILRPIPVTASDPYPVGGEMLSQVITEACLAAAERNYDETSNQHTMRFMEMLPLAIRDDLERSTPSQLGPDMPKTDHHHFGLHDPDYIRAARIGSLTLDGDLL